jgi:hypothetical protein
MSFIPLRFAATIVVYDSDVQRNRTIEFTYVPRADDPLVAAALAKNTALEEAEVAANPPTNPFPFG